MPSRLTDKFVANLRVATRTNFADDVVPGLRLRASPSGAKSWAVYYRVRGSQAERLFTLGPYGNDLTLAAARKQAKTILSKGSAGPGSSGRSGGQPPRPSGAR